MSEKGCYCSLTRAINSNYRGEDRHYFARERIWLFAGSSSTNIRSNNQVKA